MCPKPVVTGLVLSSIVFATTTAPAQVIVDVSKITCDQFVHPKITTPNLIAAWLSGCYNAKRNNKIIDLAPIIRESRRLAM
ncbi:MAG TPA: HdeA/HdeB family chaperone [Pyrinomonadaceae bacterium]